jgi:hypothetical protein
LKTEKNIEQDKLFLSGWSQGGFVTMAFLQKLEEKGVPVQAASTAAGHPDFFALFAGGIYHPRKNAALWNVAGFALAAWSYENYYRRPGLVNDLFKSEYQEDIKKLYDRSYSSNQEMQEIIGRLSSCDEKGCVLDVKRLLLDKYNDPSYFANSEFGQYSKISEARYGYYKTPTRMYYGTLDEALPPPLSKLTADYQKAIGNKHLVFALLVEKANHRATFLTAISRQYAWFNRR